MVQFALGLAAGLTIGLVIEWLVDWRVWIGPSRGGTGRTNRRATAK